ncbi:DUF6544 family protein [Algoriphagus sp. AK58]|uniref:DUF6544 family protein n=1 Tax=Algoriphagus sp. AK58 TaxID=1406877 RepID=UPI00164F0090|nr:DUF6544 family protein [Algoriphagus sp. AK58]MBC6368844.1 hypothetical protein [Algoriphagus sp. AK58]
MKAAFLSLIVIHGLIHFLGFVKGFELREIKEFTLVISRPMGLFWLLTALLFIGYAILFFLSHRYAWVLGLAALLLSQILIFMVWQDAKFGTLPNFLILLVCMVGLGEFLFERRILSETDTLLTRVKFQSPVVVREGDLNNLPEPVQKWLKRSNMVGKPKLVLGKVYQDAKMKLKPDQEKWFEASAIQYSSLEEPGFIWSVDVKMNPFLFFRGRDKFFSGRGEMLILINSLFAIVDEKGEKLDEGSLQRFLGEMVWFPSFALDQRIAWEALSDSTAKATLEVNGTRGSGIFYFTSEGDFYRFSAWRFQGNKPDSKRHEWVLEVSQHGEMQGIRVPIEMTATWKLEEGDWTWLHLKITDIQYNETALE